MLLPFYFYFEKRTNLIKILDKEEDKKKTDNDRIKEWQQEIEDLREQQEELLKYVGNAHDAVEKELELLIPDKKIAILNPNTDKKAILVTAYFIETFTTRYKEIESNPAIPFPVIADLPKYLTQEIYDKKEAAEFIFELLENERLNDEKLYAITFYITVHYILPHITKKSELQFFNQMKIFL